MHFKFTTDKISILIAKALAATIITRRWVFALTVVKIGIRIIVARCRVDASRARIKITTAWDLVICARVVVASDGDHTSTDET